MIKTLEFLKGEGIEIEKEGLLEYTLYKNFIEFERWNKSEQPRELVKGKIEYLRGKLEAELDYRFELGWEIAQLAASTLAYGEFI